MTENYFTAFIDFLGFSSFVQRNNSNPERILVLLEQFRKTLHDLDGDGVFLTSAFSDNVVIGRLCNQNKDSNEFAHELRLFIGYINYIQLIMTNVYAELPLRGGITFGSLYAKDNICFGSSMIEAYELENKSAFYPRILISRGLVDKRLIAYDGLFVARQHPNLLANGEKLKRLFGVKRDVDGMDFCNYLSACIEFSEPMISKTSISAIEMHKEFVTNRLNRYLNDRKLYQKYSWMRNYHNWFCTPFSELKDFLISDNEKS